MRPWFSKKQRPLVFNFSLTLLFSLAMNLAYAQLVDCSDPANCANAECSFAANIEKGCNCFDNIDNDGDGAIDKADGNCAAYYGLIFVGEGSDCSIVPPGSTDPFDLVDDPVVTSQNTSDTQSKISVGDVDGDGIPDAIITSKWNAEMRVVATSNGQADGSSAGDIKADYKLTGQGAKIFSGSDGCSPKNLLFEHENLIADIDKDGKAELFGVVSNRGGNPSSPPTCFFLVGFKYQAGGLVPLWDAVAIGSDRPGTFGIADMDGDGTGELYIRDRIYAAETGVLLATANGDWDLDVTSGPVAVNISGDTKMELVCGTKIYSIPTLTNRTIGSPAALTLLHDMNTIVPGVKCFVKLANDPIEYGEDTHSMCSVADIDRDGSMDVVISGALNSPTGRTAVFYWNVTKNTVSHALTPSSTDLGYGTGHAQYSNYLTGWIWGTGRVNLGDANGDGITDLSFVAGSQLFCLTTDAAGTGLQTLWTQNLTAVAGSPVPNLGYREINDSRSGVVTVTIYDFNNDGNPEMAYRDSQELAVIDGATGTVKQWSSPCQSHTYTEGPVIADVNGDGATDICVPCATAKFDIMDPIQQQALGQFRLYYSEGNEWLPTRKVWNQPGYFVVNINDDLTLPFPQLDQNLIFSNEPCPNGTPGPQMPMNVFLNQVPFLSANGCPVFPAPDLSYNGDDPDSPGTDTNGDGIFSPTVEVIPPICGDLEIKARFHIINDGDLPITANIPVSFFHGDPTDPSITADSLLFTTTINITNLAVDGTLSTPFVSFNGSGGAFRLYIVLNNDGSILPINLSGSSTTECRIDNNISSIYVDPDPFRTKIEKIQDNSKCANSAPDNGELRVRIFKGAVEQMDYSPYSFQWYTGPATSPVIIDGATDYTISGLAEGDYSVRVTNILKGCVGVFEDTVIVRLGNDPDVTITKISDQTKCDPPDGALQASVVGGNVGYTFEWFDVALTPLGIVGANATNLKAGNYVLIVSKDGCSKNIASPTILDPQIPDAQASVLEHVVDCLNPNSGSVTADALLNTVPQDPVNYTFEWYEYNLATSTRGSVLPGTFGTGQTRTGLPAGGYQVIIKDNATQCESLQTPFVEVVSQTVIPTATITEVQPQTSCDPLQPNGVLSATGVGAGLVSPNDFTFEWFKGDNTLPANLVTTVSGANGETLNEVSGGGVFYTVKVTTANNCSGTAKLIISEDINVPVVTLTSTPNGICDPAKAASQYNGTLTATVTFDGAAVALPNPNYAFTWHNGSLTTDPTIAVADNTLPTLGERNGGTYTVVVERADLHCKSLPDSEPVVNILELPEIVSDSIPSTNCVVVYNGSTIANGQASVTMVDGAAPNANYTFLWSDNGAPTDVDGQTGSSISQIQGGYIYTIEVTNTLTGCVNTDDVALPDKSVIPVVSLAVGQPNTICDPTLTVPSVQFNGRVDASFTTPSGNAADYKYTWRNVTDATPLGDTPPINTGQGVTLISQFGGLEGNHDYSVIAENTVLGCTSGAAQVFLPNSFALPIIETDSIASTNCVVNYNGNLIANGQAFVVSIDGAAPTANHTFLWSDNGSTTDADGRTTSTITQIQGGFIYTVQVTNQLTGCRNTDPVPLSDASVIPVVSLAVGQPNTICDPTLTVPSVQFNGRVDASFTTPSGNAIDYKYTWRNVTDATGLGDTPPINTGQGVTLISQFGGLEGNHDYSVIAENTVLGCTSGAAQVFLPNSFDLPIIETDSIASTNCVVNYNGNLIANGQAFVVSVDGAAPTANHTFLWSDNGSTTDADGRTTSTITQIQGGFIYTVQVTNQLTGCRNTDPVPLSDASVVPVVALAVGQPNTICDPTLTVPSVQFNGRVEASFTTPSGNAADYKYTWRNVTDATGLGDTPPINTGQGVTLISQFGGLEGNHDYSVIAENTVLGCTSGAAQVFLPNSFNLPVLETDSIASTNCVVNYNSNLIANGQAFVVSVDGAAPNANHAFLWSDNASTTDADGRTSSAITQIQGGFIYTVQVTNLLTGCRNSDAIPLADASVVPVVALSVDQPNGICNPAATDPAVTFNGRIEASFLVSSGNATDYKYTWRNVTDATNLGDTPPNNTGPGVTLVTEFGGLNGGRDYSVVAENTVLGCTSGAAQVFLPNNFVLPTIETDSIPSTNCVLVYNGNNVSNGEVSIAQVDGGVAFGDYTFVWADDGLTPTPTTATTTSVTDLEGGFEYTVSVTSKLTGCANTHIVELTKDPVVPVIAVSKITDNLNCDPALGSTGSLEAVVTYRTIVQNDPGVTALPPDYVITWNTSNNGDQLTGRAAGNYSATVVNETLGCTSNPDDDVVLDVFSYPSITLVPTDQTSCNVAAPNGELEATITITSGTMRYQWHEEIGTGGTTIGGLVTAQPTGTVTSITGRDSDDYTIFVRNELTGCEAIKSAFVPDNIVYPSIALSNLNPVTICSPTPNGSAEPMVTGVSSLPNFNYTVHFVETFTGNVYPTDPNDVKTLPNVFPHATSTFNLNSPILSQPPVYNDMPPGYLTALIVDNNTSCESNPVTVQIIDNTETYALNIDGASTAGFCGGTGGGIEVTVERSDAPGVACGSCTYEWYKATPVNPDPINFFNNPPNMGGAPLEVLVSGDDLGMPGAAPGVGAGTYTLVVVDNDPAHQGCGNYFIEAVDFTAAPVVTVTETDVTQCVAPFDGQIEVDVVGPSVEGYVVEIFSGNGPTGTLLAPSSGIQPSPVNFFKSQLASGQYYVQVTDQNATNIACPLGSVHVLEQKTFGPQISLNQIIENTSCDPNTSADGKVELTATADSDQDIVSNPTDFRISAISPAPVGLVIPIDIPDNGTSSGLMNGFGPGPYTITVIDANSGCETEAAVNIPDQPVLPTIFTVASLNESYCAPLSNGRIEVTSVGVGVPEAVNNYEFEWYSDPDVAVPANLVYNDVGGGGTTGEVFNGTKTGWSIGATAGAGHGNRTYFVRGRRITGSGIGCFTQLEQKDILDLHKTPDLSLSTFANTSCIPAAGEGVIRAVTDVEADPLDANVRNIGTYAYTWTPDPVGGNTSGGAGAANGVGINRLANFDVTALTDNTYTITSINSVSGCAVTSSAAITTNPLPITLLSYTKQDQLICDADGNIRVTEVEIDATNSAVPTVYSFATPLDLVTNFDFEWYDANNDLDLNPATYNDAVVIQSAGVDINDDILTEDGALTALPFDAMGEGTYYVVARRKPGMTPGAGCTTTPVRVDIIKDANAPEITSMEPFANTSCDAGIVEGRIELAVNTTSGVGAEQTSSYSFSWTQGDPVGNPTGAGNANGVANATATSMMTIPPGYVVPPGVGTALKDDTYTVTVENDYSGCTVTGQVVITPQKFPITIISFTKQDQLICDFDGNISVTAVTIDGSTSNLPTFNFNTPATLENNFDFRWFDANNDGDDNSGTFNDADPLEDGTATDIVDVVLSEDALETSQPFPTMGAGSYYVIAKRKAGLVPGAGCSTEPVLVTIEDLHINPVITNLDAFANTSCDNNVVEGRIELTVNTTSTEPLESGSAYTYEWDAANPAPSNPFGVGSQAGAASSLIIPPGYTPPPALGAALKDDTYTIKVTNEYSNCSTTGQVVITPQKYPVTLISFTKQDQLICDFDGRITVTQVTIDGSTSNLPVFNYNTPADLTANFDFQWFDSNNDGDNNANTFSDAVPLEDASSVIITDVVLSEDPAETTQPFPTMGAGSYYALAKRKPGMSPGAGCTTLPVRVNIEDLHINPVLTNLDAFANTSCDNNVVEGRIELTVNTTSTEPLESGSAYTYEWDAANPAPSNPFGVGSQAGAASSLIIPPGYTPPPALGAALKDDTYTIKVTNEYSNCSTTGQVVITPQKYPVTLISFTKQDQLICDFDGRITVTQVTIDGSTSNLPVFNYNTPADLTANFDFQWFDSNNDGDNNANTFSDAVPLEDASSVIITDVVLSEDPAETTQPFPTMGAGSYYALAKRKPGMSPGAGCTTLPVRVNIEDLHINPVLTNLDAFANTSCDANIVEGRIELAVSTASTEPLESGSTYTYDWNAANPVPSNPFGVGNLAGAASSLTIPPGYTPPPALGPALKDDTYTITITNEYSQCSTTGQVVITPQRYPITLISFTKQDQLICDPDGNITVTQVTIDGSTSNLPTYNFNTPAGLIANFDFTWFDANADGDNNPATFINAPLLDASSSPITDVVLSSDGTETTQPFLTMDAGTYYVMATRKPGMVPGAGCSTQPVRVNIEDLHVDPTVSFSYEPNSSCDPVNPNGIVIATASEQNGSIIDNYSFTWTLNGGPIMGVTVPSIPDNHTGRLDDAADGMYVVTVENVSNTGCDVTANIEVNKDLNRSIPNIIDVSTVDPLDCNPSASATITRISIGGTTNYNSPPDDLDAIFEYEWYQGEFQPANIIAGQDNHDLLNITADTYYVIVEDLTTACKSTPKEVLINDDDIVYPEITIDQTQLQISCPASFGTGQLLALADGENDTNADYTFSWFNSLDATGTSIASTSTLSNLIAGDYSILATNLVTGCSSSDFYIIMNEAADFLPQLALSTEPRLNCLVPDGSLLAREVGFNPGSGYPFAPNYTTEIYTGANADISQPGTAMNNVPGFSLNWLTTGLDVLTYTVKITDNNTGCVVTAEKRVENGRTPPIVMVVEDNPLINCDPLRPNGQLSATADDGKVGGYAFDWYQGATATGSILQTTNKLIGVTMGQYTVRVTSDITGCFADGLGTITDGHIDPPIPLAEVVRHNTHCKIPDGWVAASVNGIILNYSFDWYEGTTNEGTSDFNGHNYTGRAPGFYTVTAMDVTTGCFSPPASVEVLDATIIPDLAFISNPSFCEDVPSEVGRGTGSLELSLIPAEVVSDEVVWVNLQDGSPAGTGSYITGLYPGFYQAFVTTSKGCEADSTAEVKTEVLAYNLVTRNGDQKNDLFVVDCISRFPNNNVKIFNRSGVLVYEADGYNNNDVVFQGHGEKGVYATGNDLPAGTYFYIIDKRDGSKPKTGYLELVK